MRLLSSLLNKNLFALAALTAALPPQALKAQNECWSGNAIMRGTYVASGTGTVMGAGPIAVVNEIIYNGDGTGVVVSGTTVVNGTSSSSGTNVPVTYTVNRDCTGSKTIGSGPGATTLNFVITPDGSLITWIVTNNGVTFMGAGVRIGAQ